VILVSGEYEEDVGDGRRGELFSANQVYRSDIGSISLRFLCLEWIHMSEFVTASYGCDFIRCNCV